MDREMEQTLKEYQASVTDQGKEARDKLEKGFSTLRTKLDDYKTEKVKFIESWENERARKISEILSKVQILQMAQQQGVELKRDFSTELQVEYQQFVNDIIQYQLDVEIQSSDQFFHNLLQFCTVKNVPFRKSGPQDVLPQPNTQQIPKPNIAQKEDIQSESRIQYYSKHSDLFEKFVNYYREYRETFEPYLRSDIPEELMKEAKTCLTLPTEKKCTFVNFYAIILSNLNEGKDLKCIREGFYSLSVLAMCLYLSPKLGDLKSFNMEHKFYKSEIIDNVSGTQDIFRVFGYEIHQNNLSLSLKPEREVAQVEQIGCELFILLQEMADIAEKKLQLRELISHFTHLAHKITLSAPGQRPSLQSTKQSSTEKTTYGFVKENPFKSEPMDESKFQMDEDVEDDQNYALSELIVLLNQVKDEESNEITLQNAEPDQFLELAKKGVRLPLRQRYKNFPIHDLIYTNLAVHRDLATIKKGFIGIFKYVFCLVMNKENPELLQITYDQGYFHKVVSSKLSNFHETFEKFGYKQERSTLGMRLNKIDMKQEVNLMSMCCEWLIAIQEVNDFDEKVLGDPMEHFNPRKRYKYPQHHALASKMKARQGETPSTHIESHPASQFLPQSEIPTQQKEQNILSKKDPSNFESQPNVLPPPYSQPHIPVHPQQHEKIPTKPEEIRPHVSQGQPVMPSQMRHQGKQPMQAEVPSQIQHQGQQLMQHHRHQPMQAEVSSQMQHHRQQPMQAEVSSQMQHQGQQQMQAEVSSQMQHQGQQQMQGDVSSQMQHQRQQQMQGEVSSQMQQPMQPEISPQMQNQGQQPMQHQGQQPMQTEVPPQYLYHIRPKSFPSSVSELHQSIKQIRDQRIPIALHNTIPGQITLIAETCVKLEAQNKFSHPIVCDLIISNLTAGKPTNDIREGLNKMARFAFSIFTDCVESSTAVFQEGAGFFGTEIDPHLSHAYHILPFFGFDIEESARRFYLSRDKLSIPNTNDTIVFLIADLLMAEQDLKKFGYLSKDELINFYHQYPTVAQYSDVMPSKKQPQSQPPQSSGDQSQYSSTFTTQNPAAQMQPHSRPQSDMPPPSSMRRTLEAESQYASGASGPGAPVHSMQGYAGQPSVQQHRAAEPDPNNFNVAAHSGSGYNVPQRYSQEQHHPSMNMSPHSTGDLPPGMPFQPPSHSQPSNVTTREWSCPHCTALNAATNRICNMCNKSPDFKIEQQSAQNMPEQISQQKQCQRCNQMNRLQEVSCVICHASFM